MPWIENKAADVGAAQIGTKHCYKLKAIRQITDVFK